MTQSFFAVSTDGQSYAVQEHIADNRTKAGRMARKELRKYFPGFVVVGVFASEPAADLYVRNSMLSLELLGA